MKKTFLTLAVVASLIAGTEIVFAAPPPPGHNYGPPPSGAAIGRPPYERLQPPPPPPHHHHPPHYYSQVRYINQPPIITNRVIQVNYPNGGYIYSSTPYVSYPGYYPYYPGGYYNNYFYPNKTLTVRTKHVLFSI